MQDERACGFWQQLTDTDSRTRDTSSAHSLLFIIKYLECRVRELADAGNSSRILVRACWMSNQLVLCYLLFVIKHLECRVTELMDAGISSLMLICSRRMPRQVVLCYLLLSTLNVGQESWRMLETSHGY